MKLDELISLHNLKPHFKGGSYFAETYRSTLPVGVRYCGESQDARRGAVSSILYLLTDKNVPTFHKVKQDELMFFHSGSPVEVLQIKKDGTAIWSVMGSDYLKGHVASIAISSDVWQATRVQSHNSYGLLSAVVAPGFDINDYEDIATDILISKFPNLKSKVTGFVAHTKWNEVT